MKFLGSLIGRRWGRSTPPDPTYVRRWAYHTLASTIYPRRIRAYGGLAASDDVKIES